ncbi:MAG: phasin family protein [Burkholderiaceae bacterium]|nr:phasin family protein [Burkholderiaceae bacterium]
MAKKLKALAEGKEAKSDLNQLAKTIRDSAQQIWLAGLGAFAKAQGEGGKVFDTLVKEGLNLQRRTRAATEERIGSVGEKMTRAAGDLSKQATQSWDRLEQVFEDRVSRALTRLGVPTSREIGDLVARVDALSEAVQSLTGGTVKRAARKANASRAATPGTNARAAKSAAPAAKAAKAASAAPAAKAPARRTRAAAKTASGDGKAAA